MNLAHLAALLASTFGTEHKQSDYGSDPRHLGRHTHRQARIIGLSAAQPAPTNSHKAEGNKGARQHLHRLRKAQPKWTLPQWRAENHAFGERKRAERLARRAARA